MSEKGVHCSSFSCTSPTSVEVSDEMEAISTSISETSTCSLSKSGVESPCSRCIELARVFYESLHDDENVFTMPTWVSEHKSFTAVVESTLSEGFRLHRSSASDALIFAVCGCFTPLNSTRACCAFPLIRTMLTLPNVNPGRRRARNLTMELVLHASAFFEGLKLREQGGGMILLEYLTTIFERYFTCSLNDKSQMGVEEHSEVVLCYQILINLSRQVANRAILRSHGRLVSVCVRVLCHPLVDAQILQLSLEWVVLCQDFVFTEWALDVMRENRLLDMLVSMMEMYTDGMLSCLICPVHIPSHPDKLMLTNLSRAANAFAHSVDLLAYDGYTASRLLNVITTTLGAEHTVFELADVTSIAATLAAKHPMFVTQHRQFIPILARLCPHVWAGKYARQTLRSLLHHFPQLKLPLDIQRLLEETRIVDQ